MINNMADFTKLNASMPFFARHWIHFYTAYVQDNKMGMKMAAKMFLDEFYKHIANFNPLTAAQTPPFLSPLNYKRCLP